MDLCARAEAMFLLTSERTTTAEAMAVVVEVVEDDE